MTDQNQTPLEVLRSLRRTWGTILSGPRYVEVKEICRSAIDALSSASGVSIAELHQLLMEDYKRQIRSSLEHARRQPPAHQVSAILEDLVKIGCPPEEAGTSWQELKELLERK